MKSLLVGRTYMTLLFGDRIEESHRYPTWPISGVVDFGGLRRLALVDFRLGYLSSSATNHVVGDNVEQALIQPLYIYRSVIDNPNHVHTLRINVDRRERFQFEWMRQLATIITTKQLFRVFGKQGARNCIHFSSRKVH